MHWNNELAAFGKLLSAYVFAMAFWGFWIYLLIG